MSVTAYQRLRQPSTNTNIPDYDTLTKGMFSPFLSRILTLTNSIEALSTKTRVLTSAYDKTLKSPGTVLKSRVPTAILPNSAYHQCLQKSSSPLWKVQSCLRILMTSSWGMRLGEVVLQVLLVVICLRTVRALLVLDFSCRVAGTGLLMWCQVFLCIKGLRDKLTLHHILSIMGFEMAVKPSLCEEGQLTTLRCAREPLSLVCLLVFLEQLIVPKIFISFITHKGVGIHVSGSDVGLDGCSSTLQRLLTQGAFFISNLHSLNHIFHLVLFIGSACIHPKCLQYFHLDVMYLLTFPDLCRINVELGGWYHLKMQRVV